MSNAHISPCCASAQSQPNPKSITYAPPAKNIIHEFFGVIWFGATVVTKLYRRKRGRIIFTDMKLVIYSTTLDTLLNQVYFDAKKVLVS